jgi:hypothetical protein
MLKLLLGLGLVGLGFSLGLTFFHHVHKDHLRYMGQLDERGRILGAIRQTFGERQGEPYEGTLFDLKTDSAAIVTVNGVKTLRYSP